MDGMHFPLKKWAVRAIQSHIDTHYIEMMSMNHTTNFNHIMQIAVNFRKTIDCVCNRKLFNT